MKGKLNRPLGCVLCLLALAALGPATATSAAAPGIRAYDSQITGLNAPQALTVAPDGQVWVSDIGTARLSRYDAYPSQTKLEERTGGKVWAGLLQLHSVAVSEANDYLYAGTDISEGHGGGGNLYPKVGTFDNFGVIYQVVEREQPGQRWLAVDNSPQSDSFGRVYLYSDTYGNSTIEAFDGYGNPVNFTGSAGYINKNKIEGTAYGLLGSGAAGQEQPRMPGIAVDPEGNIWVVDVAQKAIDEFAPSGVFIRKITQASSGAPATFASFNPLSASRPYGSGAGGLGGVAIDPTTGDIVVSDISGGVLWEFSPQGTYLGEIDGSDTPAGHFGFDCQPESAPTYCVARIGGLSFNSQGYLYVTDGVNHVVDIFAPRHPQPTIVNEPYGNPSDKTIDLHASIGLNGGGNVTDCNFRWGTSAGSYPNNIDCEPEKTFGSDREVSAHIAAGLSDETTYHYRVEVSNASATRIGADQTFTPHKVLSLRADPVTGVSASGATLHGSFVGNGAHTTYWFEYGTDTSYGTSVPLPAPPGGDAGSPAGPGRTGEEAVIGGLKPVTRYHYRIVGENGSTSFSEDQSFRTQPLLPEVKTESVTDVHSEQVILHGKINPGGADATYYFELGTEDCSNLPDPCSPAGHIDAHVGSNLEFDSVTRRATGLQPNTTYFYRAVATNSAGVGHGAVRTFSTYPFSSELKDACPNALARQQTGSALLSDCRAYELVSSAHAGGYDVESTLVPGQEPFDGYPLATNPPRALYGVHNGAIPGVPGNPTNRGVDPYVATRGKDGWTTSYVGIPADDSNATAPFASTLLEADPNLDTFAFGGPDICSPCFEDGSTGVPVHLPDGSLVQGMKGSIEPPSPAASDGLVKKSFSADGAHFVFSTTTELESPGNDSTGDVSIYDRNLETDATQVVSTDSSGNPLACLQGAGNCHAPGNKDGIAELDISKDGSRIVTGQRISTDADGNDYFHLYMHVGTSPNAVDLTEGAIAGALFDGMTEDGTRVFFTTKDHLLPADTDNSADIYEASVDSGGALSLRLVSTEEGTASNDDSCSPPGFPTSWNAATGDGKCNAVAFAGGAGVAATSGTFYFLSPELLDAGAQADGQEDQPNLYVVQPGGDPEFVATIDTPTPPAYLAGTSKTLLTGLKAPESVAVDQNSGDIYVTERETGEVSRWKPDGTPANFSALPGPTNKISGQSLGGEYEGQIAVDSSSSSPLSGDLYVTTNGSAINVFSADGTAAGEITGFGEACGVAVDQSTGDVYVGDYFGSIATVTRFRPKAGAAPPISNADYEPVEGANAGFGLCNIDASAEGHVYTWPYGEEAIKQFNGSAFTTSSFPTLTGTAFAQGTNAQSDPKTGDLFVDEHNAITRYDSAGGKVEQFGGGIIEASRGIGVNGNTAHVYATSGGSSIVDFEAFPSPSEPINNPAIVHAVRQAGIHRYGDFQVSPSGQYATFTTKEALDEGFENLGHSEVYRYDAGTHQLDCVSCPPSNALATGDASLASNGLSLTDDGRVFFDTEEPLVLRDDDNAEDVYEWEEEGAGPPTGGCAPGNPNRFPTGICLSLISSGSSQFDSSLLGASADGTDAYFFTHDTLAREDENGPVTKLYDARVNGGFFAVPPPALCAASDECHGPGTEAAEPPNIATRAGTPSTAPTKRSCKKGFVRKHGKCVRKKRRHKRNHRRTR